MNRFFKQFAETLEHDFGAHFDREEGFVECPECGNEPIYDCDWEPSEYMKYSADGHVVWYCPVCHNVLFVSEDAE